MSSLDTCRVLISEAKPDVLPELLSAGTSDGTYVTLSRSDYERIFRRVRGLGDAVAIFAKPIARAIDRTLHTDLEHCPGCSERQDRLNKLFPFQ